MGHLHKSLGELSVGVAQKAEILQRDLVEPLELYYKHYNSTNQELLRQAN